MEDLIHLLAQGTIHFNDHLIDPKLVHGLVVNIPLQNIADNSVKAQASRPPANQPLAGLLIDEQMPQLLMKGRGIAIGPFILEGAFNLKRIGSVLSCRTAPFVA